MAKRLPCEVWVSIVEQCVPSWAGSVLPGAKPSAGLRACVASFLGLARVNRTLRAAMEVVCEHYFCAHCAPGQPLGTSPKSPKHATWASALGRVFQIIVSRHKSHGGKLLCAGVAHTVCKELHFLSLDWSTHDVQAVCVKLFERGLLDSVLALASGSLRRAWLCLPQLVKHASARTPFHDMECLADLNDMDNDYLLALFDDLPDYDTVQGLAALVRQSDAGAVCRFVAAAGRGLLRGLLNKCFKTNLNDSLFLVCHLLADATLWDMWVPEWWHTFEPRYTYWFEMSALLKVRPELPTLVSSAGHSIIGHIVPVCMALTVPGWVCRPSVNYTGAVVDVLTLGDADSLDSLFRRGLTFSVHTMHVVSAWLQHMCANYIGKPKKRDTCMAHALECLFDKHGYTLSPVDRTHIKDNLPWLPVNVSIALLRAVIKQGDPQ